MMRAGTATTTTALTPPVAVDLSRPVLYLTHDHRPMGMRGNRAHAVRPVTVTAAAAIMLIKRGAAYMVDTGGDYVRVHRTGEEVLVPSVVALRRAIPYCRLEKEAAFSLPMLYIRDVGTCQYSGERVYLGAHTANGHDLTKDPRHRGTFDHVVPQSKGGARGWDNALLASEHENVRKGNLMPERYTKPLHAPWVPTQADLLRLWLTDDRLSHVPVDWLEYLDRAPASDQVRRVMDSHAERGNDVFRWQREVGDGLAA